MGERRKVASVPPENAELAVPPENAELAGVRVKLVSDGGENGDP